MKGKVAKKAKAAQENSIRDAVAQAAQVIISVVVEQLKLCPSSQDEMVDQSLQDHVQNLTGNHPVLNDLLNGYDLGLPVDHQVTDKQRSAILAH